MARKIDNKIIILALFAIVIALWSNQPKAVVEGIPTGRASIWDGCNYVGNDVVCNLRDAYNFNYEPINGISWGFVHCFWKGYIEECVNVRKDLAPWCAAPTSTGECTRIIPTTPNSCSFTGSTGGFNGCTGQTVTMWSGNRTGTVSGDACILTEPIPTTIDMCGVYGVSGSVKYYYEEPITCMERWNCTAWSSCSIITSTRTRTCTDSNNCGTVVNKSAESESCTPFECTSNATASTNCANKTHVACTGSWYCKNDGTCAWKCDVEPCVQNWQCSQWSSCSNNEQTRVCTDSSACNNVTGKLPEWQSCHVNRCEDFGYSTGTLPQATYDCIQIRAGGLDCWNCTKKENILFKYWYMIVIAIVIVGIIYYKKFR